MKAGESAFKNKMEKLTFLRHKYGRELLIDACTVDELDIPGETAVMAFYTVILLESCTGVYFLDTQPIELQPHTVIFVKPGQINQVAQANFHAGHFLFFEGDFLDDFFEDKHFIHKFGYFHQPNQPAFLRLSPEDFSKYNEIAAEIWREIRNLSQDSLHILRSLIYYLLVRLHQLFNDRHGRSGDTIPDPTALHFLKLLEKEVRSNLPVAAYADRLGVSRVHLNSTCQKYFSKTAHSLIRERLISELKKEIRYSDRDLSSIAYDFNFSAPSHFARFFKQMTGLSPKDFRDDLSFW